MSEPQESKQMSSNELSSQEATKPDTIGQLTNDDSQITQLRLRRRRLVRILLGTIVVWGVVTLVRMFLPASALQQARTAVDQQNFSTAIEQYVKHLASSPDDWNVRMELGTLLTAVDRPQALSELRKIPPEAESYPLALKQIADICLSSERYTEADEALTALTKVQPNDGEPHLLLAESHFRQNRPQVALSFALRAAELSPSVPRAHSLLAEILDDLNRPAEMVEPLKKLLALNLEDYGTHLNLSYAFSEAGNPEEARREAAWCLARNPKDVNARRFLAASLRDLGERERAMAEIQTALQAAPDDLECRLIEAELLLHERKGKEAYDRLKPLYEQHSRDRRLVALLARAASSAGLEEEAKSFRDQVQKLSER